MSPIDFVLAARASTTSLSAATATPSSTAPSGDDLNLPPWAGPVAWAALAIALLIILYTGGKSLRKTLNPEKTLEEKILNPSLKERTSTSSETTLVDAQPKPRVSRLAPPPPAYIARASLSMSKDEGALFRLTGANTWHNKLASQRDMARVETPLPPILRPEACDVETSDIAVEAIYCAPNHRLQDGKPGHTSYSDYISAAAQRRTARTVQFPFVYISERRTNHCVRCIELEIQGDKN
ncbi:hypothetical protein C8R47DRAFT_1066715 [Mycena vitilis]|nr:hypothetical protein C8R47DRAFT_1066715 [Mycena vitilis]